MIELIRENKLASMLISLFILIALFFQFFTQIVEYERTGKVIGHNAIGNKYGTDIYYYTIIHFGNEITSVEGLRYYAVPVGSTVTVTYKKLVIL